MDVPLGYQVWQSLGTGELMCCVELLGTNASSGLLTVALLCSTLDQVIPVKAICITSSSSHGLKQLRIIESQNVEVLEGT